MPATVGAASSCRRRSAARDRQRQDPGAQRPRPAPGRVVRRRQRRPRARLRVVAERRPPEADRRRRGPGRHDDRSDRGERTGQADAAAVARAGARGAGAQPRQLRQRLRCVYINTISWRTPTTPVPMEIHPRVVFDRLFGDGGSAGAAAGAGAQDSAAFSTRCSRKRRGCSRRSARRPHQGRTSIWKPCARSSSGSSAPSSRPAS